MIKGNMPSEPLLKSQSKKQLTPIEQYKFNRRFLRAAQLGDLSKVEKLIEEGACVDFKTKKYGETVLMQASRAGYVDIVKTVIGAGAEVKLRDKSGKSALLFASANDHEEIVKILISNGADVNASKKNNKTPLMYASENGFIGIVELLLENYADPTLKDQFDNSALSLALKNKHLKVVRILRGFLLEKYPNLINALFENIHEGNVNRVLKAIETGVNVNVCNESSNTMLILTCYHGNEGHLMNERESFIAATRNGWRGFVKNNGANRMKIVNALLSKGADINAVNCTGETALMVAVFHGHLEYIKKLISANALLNIRSNEGETALGYAIERNSKYKTKKTREIVNLLRAHGAVE
jgi:ankyrin repeat protein